MNMKKIYQLILGLSAFAWLAPAAMAQNIPAGQYKEENGVAYNKSVSQTPDENGRYTIELDAFVTGKVKTVTEYKPADIVLVLDVSKSMNESINTTIVEKEDERITYQKVLYGINNGFGQYYYKVDEEYYPLEVFYEENRKRDGSSLGSRQKGYFVYYTVNGVRYYLVKENGTSKVVTIPKLTEDGVQGLKFWTSDAIKYLGTKNTTEVYHGKVWQYDHKEKIELLRIAASSFVNTIAENNTKEDGTVVGHSVGLITFGAGSDKIYDLTDISVAAEKNKIVNYLEHTLDIDNAGGTKTDEGMDLAVNLFTGRPDENSRVIVLFTDGEPHDGIAHTGSTNPNKPLNVTIANHAIEHSYDFKNNMSGIVFTVGLLPSGTDDKVYDFLRYVSSDYPHAQSMEVNGSEGPGPDPDDPASSYSQSAGGEDLTSIFEAIAESASSTAGNTSVTAEASVMTDIVSSSFKIPEAANVELLVAPCLGKVAGAWQFGEAKDAKQYEPWKSDATEPVPAYAADEDNSNIIHVTGFDFSKHFCAVDGEGNIVNDKGAYKLVLRFQVAVNEDATGGPAVATNDPESGIYVDSTPIVKFNQPSMHSPSVSLVIVKQGLKTGETAQYTIQRRAATDEDFDPIAYPDYDPENAYTDYLNVLVIGDEQKEQTYTKTDGTTVKGRIVRIDGLDSNYYYRVKETDWSWTYKNGALTPITSKTLTNNPFIFSNTKQETGIKNAESVKRNEFNAN